MTDLNPVDAMTTNPYRAMCAELIERLEWFIAEDETNENDPGNQYWLTGKQAGIDSVARARALLAQPEPQPVPVSERLPEPNDCNDEGYCWWWRTDEVGEWWEFLYLRDARDHNRRCGLARYTHWLPYHAIPNLPNPND